MGAYRLPCGRPVFQISLDSIVPFVIDSFYISHRGFLFMDDRIILVPIEQIDRPVKISRELIDPERVRELAESIRENGLLQPVLLRPKYGRYEMIAGDRRFLAHKLLGLKEIKAIVKECSESEMFVIRGIENLQRENLSPSEEAMVYLLLREEGGLSLNQIAKKCGKAPNTIDRYLHFAKCSEEVRRAVDRKEVSLNTLEKLQEIDDPEAFMFYFRMGASNGITAQVAALWVDDWKKTKAGTYYDGDSAPPPSNIEVESKPIFMTCEICNGPCEIHKIRSIVSCPECGKGVRGSRVGKSSLFKKED
jgi:ParB/RepB/Spo0J family partition protein